MEGPRLGVLRGEEVKKKNPNPNRLYLSDTTGYWHESVPCLSLRKKCLQTRVRLRAVRSSMMSI